MSSTKFQPFQVLYQQVRQYDPKLYQALDLVSQNIQNLHTVVAPIVATAAPLSFQFIKNTITAATLIAAPTPTLGALLCELLVQDATGGHLITWDAMFGSVPDLGLCPANTYSTLIFVADGARWWLAAPAVINQVQ